MIVLVHADGLLGKMVEFVQDLILILICMIILPGMVKVKGQPPLAAPGPGGSSTSSGTDSFRETGFMKHTEFTDHLLNIQPTTEHTNVGSDLACSRHCFDNCFLFGFSQTDGLCKVFANQPPSSTIVRTQQHTGVVYYARSVGESNTFIETTN